MRSALAFAGLAALVSVTTVATTAAGERSRGLSLEQIRGVMRANAAAFNACLDAATRRRPDGQLHGPFLYQIEVDRQGKVTSARPYHPSGVAAFDRCVTAVLKRARFPGGPASVETPLVFDPS
jgi:TonB family protein